MASTSSSSNFDAWLNDKLCEHKLDSVDSNDVNLFLNYIISLLNSDSDYDDPATCIEEQIESISPILQELNPESDTNKIRKLSNEIIDKWKQYNNNNNNKLLNNGSINNQTNNNNNYNDINKSNNRDNATITKIEDDDDNDAIFNIIKEHKPQIIETKKTNKSQEKDKVLSNYAEISDNEDGNNKYYLYESDDDDDDGGKAKGGNLFENLNGQSVLENEKKQREKMHENYLKQKERNKKDQQAQKDKEEERKKKAKQRAAKVERKA